MCPASRNVRAASASKSVKRRAASPLRRTLPTLISTRSLHQSAHGTGAPMLHTGWPTRGLFRTGKLVSPARYASCVRVRESSDSEHFCATASSIIKVGLSWKLAIGACVLGNAIMGLVITINGRMGATVGCILLQRAEPKLTWNSFTLRFPSSHACHSATTSATSLSCLAVYLPLSGSG